MTFLSGTLALFQLLQVSTLSVTEVAVAARASAEAAMSTGPLVLAQAKASETAKPAKAAAAKTLPPKSSATTPATSTKRTKHKAALTKLVAAAKSAAAESKSVPTDPKAINSKQAIALTLKVQRFYERTEDFSAHFVQTYRYKLLSRSTKSSGEVQFKKPGLMRWDYERPHKKLFVIDGKSLWVYTPEDHSVIKRPNFKPGSLSSSITFLWGKGKLVEEFDLRLLSEHTLALSPKTPQAGFSALQFVVDGQTGQVMESTVIDAQGNTNHMVFSKVKLDGGLPDARFRFTPPKGVTVQIL